MQIEIQHIKSEPAWRVSEITDSGRKVIETHYGDHCDANERRYARERANNLARVLASRHGAKIVRVEA